MAVQRKSLYSASVMQFLRPPDSIQAVVKRRRIISVCKAASGCASVVKDHTQEAGVPAGALTHFDGGA